MRLSSVLRYRSSFTLYCQSTSAARSTAIPIPPPRVRVSLAARHQPWPSMPNPAAWNAVLEQYARLHNPECELPKGVHLLSDSKCVTIFDGYEKAKYHFLVMPRYPFPLESSSSPSSASTSTSISVPSSHLTSLEALRKSPYCLRVLHALQEQARQVQEMIEEEMLKKEGWKWPIHIGFHARESMRHVHLHVISSDLISPKLKNKKTRPVRTKTF
ncbi:hypothetical protein MVLG_00994 [Microbotryum lychnidis-dioicae p1A1 Lamole]|uniref:HIT domain-containing protein n=2 Tax=Microbotryum lychnidis-dioicae (strain p1A1 Lamole / MvSl-1064) TaxID=683840 RepID=U5H0S1_USTV1|nr:hypothetical protein MVLG_00994 [Microbotryum lychnidis-dioicae p1A1 Lamole]|eukprot:KDE08898.1 hypothetical protein MVLG_00994 [Microbotryum lychnidis-dioicae p1A1 Lamole]